MLGVGVGAIDHTEGIGMMLGVFMWCPGAPSGDGLDGPWKPMLTLHGKHIAKWSLPSSKQDSSEKAGVSISQATKVNRGPLYK